MELEKLLNISLEKERFIVPQYARMSKDEHVSIFWKIAHVKKAYCSVDTKALFQNFTAWLDVWEYLQN